jgi:hypothetical protein
MTPWRGGCASPEPGAPAPRQFEAAVLLRRVERMRRGVDMHAGPELHVVADLDAVAVQQHAVEVHEHAAADMDVEAVVAM